MTPVSPTVPPTPGYAQGGLNPLAGRAYGTDRERLRALAKEFTAVLVGQAFKNMQGALPMEQIGFGGSGERMFRELLYESYAQRVVQRGQLGLSDLVARSLLGRARAAGPAEAEATSR